MGGPWRLRHTPGPIGQLRGGPWLHPWPLFRPWSILPTSRFSSSRLRRLHAAQALLQPHHQGPESVTAWNRCKPRPKPAQTMIWLLLVALFSFVLFNYLQDRPRIHRNGQRLRRPYDSLPLLGNAIRFLQPREVLFDWFVQCQQQFGLETFEISVPTLPPGVVISDPKSVEFVLKNEAAITKGEFFRKRSWDLFGYGIINATGDLWKMQRKAGLKFFSGSNLDVMIEDVLPKVYAKSSEELQAAAVAGKAVDLQKVLLDLTTTVMGQMAYDMDIDSSLPFSSAFDFASDHVGLRFQNPLYSITEFFTGSNFRTALAEVKRFGRKMVINAKRRRAEEAFESLITAEKVAFGSLIDSLLDAFPNPTIVADAALNFLSAGRDTTAQSMTWTMYLLMRHPETVTLIRNEATSIFSADIEDSLQVDAASLQPSHLPITMSVFYESLRLYPPVPFEIKQCEIDVTLPDGTFLPKGSVIVWCIWAMNRAAKTFGPDAHIFRPSRWLDECGKFVPKSPFEYPVFNGGPRACLGKKMAELMAAYVITNLSKDFQFQEIRESVVGDGERKSQNSLTLPMKGGLLCKVEKLKN